MTNLLHDRSRHAAHARHVLLVIERPATHPDLRQFVSVLQDLETVFRATKGSALAFPFTGTGGWEAAIENTVQPGDKILDARQGVRD